MNARQPTRAFLLTLVLTAAAAAQSPLPSQASSAPTAPPAVPRPVHHHVPRPTATPAPVQNLNLVVLDPAHGGSDPGAKFGPNLLEKEIDLAFAQRLRTALASRGFTVQLTRENDGAAPQPGTDPNQPAPPPPQLTLDARAEQSNRNHPLACLLLHATPAGRGVHLYTSSLTPVPPIPAGTLDQDRPIQLWDDVQAPLLPESRKLAADLAQSIRNLRLPLVTGASSVAPIDALSCPALAIELAPLGSGSSPTEPNDAAYQDRLVTAIADSLTTFRNQLQSAQPLPAAPLTPGKAAPATPPKPKPKPKPRPVVPAPDVPPAAAPIVRVPEPAQSRPAPPPEGAQ